MPRRAEFPERLGVRLPKGTAERIVRASGLDAASRKSGQDVHGPVLRPWILERLEAEEATLGKPPEPRREPPAAKAPEAPADELLRRFLSLLDGASPRLRERIERRLGLLESDKETFDRQTSRA